MLSPARVWSVLLALYVAFFAWYTSFGGPLTAEEIDRYTAVLSESGAPPEQLALVRRFMESDTGDDFVMQNSLHLRDTPRATPGVEPGDTSADVMSRYTGPFMRMAILDAAHPIFYGAAASDSLDLWGIAGAEHWTHGGLVRYRSRRDLMEQVVRMVDADIHGFKEAALEKTIAFPVDPWFSLGDPRLVFGLGFAVVGLALHLRHAGRDGRRL